MDIAAELSKFSPATWFIVAGLAIVVIAAAVMSRQRRAHDGLDALVSKPAEPTAVRIAMIIEKREMTPGGGAGMALVLINWVICIIWFSQARSAPQEAVVLLAWIGGSVMFGLWAALGIRRTYTVYRGDGRQE